MKRSIWKFPLEITDYQSVNIPTYAEILSVQVKDDIPYIYAIVNPQEETETRHFEIFGTGNPFEVEENIKRVYIGTFFSHKDRFVWHLFERIN
jgi:hypothetical protein